MMGGIARDYGHEITVDGNTVCRDGKAVRIKANLNTRDLQVGCTKVTRAALLRLLELSNRCDIDNMSIIQEGAA